MRQVEFRCTEISWCQCKQKTEVCVWVCDTDSCISPSVSSASVEDGKWEMCGVWVTVRCVCWYAARRFCRAAGISSEGLKSSHAASPRARVTAALGFTSQDWTSWSSKCVARCLSYSLIALFYSNDTAACFLTPGHSCYRQKPEFTSHVYPITERIWASRAFVSYNILYTMISCSKTVKIY